MIFINIDSHVILVEGTLSHVVAAYHLQPDADYKYKNVNINYKKYIQKTLLIHDKELNQEFISKMESKRSKENVEDIPKFKAKGKEKPCRVCTDFKSWVLNKREEVGASNKIVSLSNLILII